MRKIYYFILPFLCLFLASCTSNTTPQTPKSEIVKVAKKIKMDTIYLLEGDINEKN